MIKYLKYIPIFFLLALVVCVFSIKEQNLKGVIPQKEFIVAGERVLVGGEQMLGAVGNKFKPEVKLEKWGNETHIRVWSDDEVEYKATMKGEKVVSKSKDGKREYNFYEVENGFEYEVILKEKPKTNVIELNIDLKGLECYYQPELTQEEKDEGSSRPENVIGSYACYHITKSGDYSKMGGKNYKVGKAFHIYRPQIEDSNGWKVWEELNIDKGILTITIPQEFLDKANYPVSSKGVNFGKEDIGGSTKDLVTYSSPKNYRFLRGTIFNLSETGNVTSISAYINDTLACNKQYAIYNAAKEIEAVTDIDDLGGGTDWQTLDLSSPTELSSGDYGLVAASNGVNGSSGDIIYYDTTVSAEHPYTYNDSGTSYVNNFPEPYPSLLNSNVSIYATYTADTPAEDTKKPLPIIQF